MRTQTALESICNNDMADFACKLDEIIKASEKDLAMKTLLLWLQKDLIVIWDDLEALVEL